MEDHLKICVLEEVACEFERVGCKETHRKEDLQDHGRDNMEKHLALTATTVVVKIKFQFSIRTTAVERVNRCRIEPVLPQNRDRSTAVLRPRNGAVSIKIAVLRPLVTPYNC